MTELLECFKLVLLLLSIFTKTLTEIKDFVPELLGSDKMCWTEKKDRKVTMMKIACSGGCPMTVTINCYLTQPC